MKYITLPVLATMALMAAGCSKQDVICCDGGYEYRHRTQASVVKPTSSD